MIHKIQEDVWFDSENLYVITSQDRLKRYTEARESLPPIRHRDKREWKPTLVFLSATVCNLKCKYCYAHEGSYGMVDPERCFTFENYVKVYDFFYEAHGGIKAINFFGGEPLLNFSEIKKFVVYLHEHYRASELPTLSVASNGTIMNEEIKDFLERYKVHFSTSLDGGKEINDKNRYGKTVDSVYDCVVKTLDDLSDSEIARIVQFTMSRDYIKDYKKGDISGILSQFEKLPIVAYELIPVASGDDSLRIRLEDAEERARYETLCDDLADYYLDRLCQPSAPVNSLSRLVVGLLLRIVKREYQSDCTAGHSVSITPAGVIYPCHTFAGSPEYGVPFDDDFGMHKLDENKYFSAVRKATRQDTPACAECIGKQLCAYWCRGISMCYNNDIHSVLKERCIIMDRVTRKVVMFLAGEQYRQNKATVRENISAMHHALSQITAKAG